MIENETIAPLRRFKKLFTKTKKVPTRKTEVTCVGKYLDRSDILLDFGCRDGRFTNQLSTYVKSIHAIEKSGKMLQSAIKTGEQMGISNIWYSQSSLFQSYLREESYTKITAFNTISFEEDISKTLHRMNSLLREKGGLILSTQCLKHSSLIRKSYQYAAQKAGITPEFHFLSLDQITHEILQAGFEINDVHQIATTPEYLIAATRN